LDKDYGHFCIAILHQQFFLQMSIQLQTVGIVVADMSKSLKFYRTLGLPIPDDKDKETNVDYKTPNGITLGFLTMEMATQADPNFKTPVGQSMNLQFMCDSPAEVDSIYARLMQADYESYAEPWDAFWGQRFARVKDPDSRIVNIYAHLAD
jgi:catechol 2,3-dioxygenase-like lactoylglutathione lyase family enzyme